MAYVTCDVEPTENEIERLERHIKDFEKQIAEKKAYIDFLKANPIFEEYHKLRKAAN